MLRSTTLAAIMLAGSSLGLATVPAGAAAPASYASNHELAPRVSDFDVRSVRRVQPGTPLRFTLEGTPGARASVSIDGTQRTLQLAETGPGIYQGTYVVSVRDRITPDSRVTAHLQRGDMVGTALLAEPLQRDWSMASVTRPQITQVRVGEEDRNGRTWLRYTVYGTAGAQASVQIEGDRPRSLALDEVRPGEYTALYRLRPGVSLDVDRPLVARLRVGDRVTTSSVARAYDQLSPATLASAWCDDCGVVEAVHRIDRGYGSSDYEVIVRTSEGRQVVTYDGPPPVTVGDAVRVLGNTLERRTG